jgi:cytochrome c1
VLTPAPGLDGGDPRAGQRLLIDKGCGGCHTVAGVPGASGVAGPNLTNIGLRPTLAGASIPNSPQTMTAWLMDPSALKPDARMPNTGLTQQEAQDLTAFLFSQPYNPSS